MLQLFAVTSFLFLVGTLAHTSGFSDAEPQKTFSIVWTLSAAICVQRGAFEKNKKIQLPLNQASIYDSLGEKPKPLCSSITRTNCETSNCQKRFQCKNTQQNPSPRTRTGTRTVPNIIIRMKSKQKCEALTIPCQNETGCVVNATTRALGVTSVVDSLKSHATKTQASVLNILKSSTRKKSKNPFVTEPLWITNEIIVKGASLGEVQEMLKGNSDVAAVRPERLFQIFELSPNPNPKIKSDPPIVIEEDWSMKAVEADKVWAEGINGNGIILGHIDSGVFAEHEALKNNFRGEYGWFDPYFRKPEPYDDNAHGTFTLGIAVGRTKGLGAAPGATWMSCKGCRADGLCTETARKACAQWILCPTKADGSDPDCSKAPHVVNNSWGDYIPEDDSDDLWQEDLEEIIQCWRSAGIITVFAVGNSGPNCSTAVFPAVLKSVIAVGNVDKIVPPNSNFPFEHGAYFDSSRGPTHRKFAQVLKPDVGAPGTSITSASSTDPQKYITFGGSSAAAPIVTGIIALMLQKNPLLQHDQVLHKLIKSCSPVFVPDNGTACGNISRTKWPNNYMGHGIINAFKAVFRT